MSPGHPDIGPELRQLAQAILDRLDPALRAAAAMAAGTRDTRCQQVWCPVCALAALVTGEQHPLLTVIADHSVSLLAVIRAMVAEPPVGEPPAAEPTPAPPPGGGSGPAKSRYQDIPIVHIPVTGEPAGRID